MSSTPEPYSITAPAVMVLQPDAAGTFKVVNSGSKPIQVTGSLGRYNDKSLHYPAASHATLTTFSQPWVTFTPHQFRLQPGQSVTVRISDHVPAGTQGHHYLNVAWLIKPVTTGPTTAGTHLQGAVATSIDIPMPGHAVAVTSHGQPQPPPLPPGQFPVLLVLIPALLLVLAVATAAALAARRARNRHLQRARTS